MTRHHQLRRARAGADFRWSRIPLESRGKVSAVEYRLFCAGPRGQLHQEHLLVTTLDSRTKMAAALTKARRRLRAKVRGMPGPAGPSPGISRRGRRILSTERP